MTIRVVVGRKEGFVSSVGFISEGMPFLCQGKECRGLHWEPAENRRQAVVELRYLLGYLKAAGNVVTGEELLDELS